MTAITPTSFIGIGRRWESFRLDSGLLGLGPFQVDAGLGNDFLNGNIGADSLVGGGGLDVLIGDAGDDLIHGDTAGPESSEDGEDRIFGGSGRDSIYGGGGLDVIQGGDDADLLVGDGGDDRLDGGAGGDALFGGLGDDMLRGNGSIYLRSFSVLYAWDGTTDIYVGAPRTGGQDVPVELVIPSTSFTDDSAGDWLSGGEGQDILIGDGGSDTLYGDAGHDMLFGDNAPDSPSNEWSSWDIFDAISGNDLLFGGEGNDTLNGGAGNNWLDGGSGEDRVFYAGTNGVTVFLNHGMAFRDGGQQGDTLVSIEILWGSYEADWLVGRDSADVIDGKTGNDWLFGLDGNDRIHGGDRAPFDYSYDRFYDSDQIIGGKGSDTLSGGADNDQFWFLAADFERGVFDYIMDFGESAFAQYSKWGHWSAPNYDYLRFEGVTASQLTFTDHGGYCLISTLAQGGDGGIVVFGMTAARLMDQVIFA